MSPLGVTEAVPSPRPLKELRACFPEKCRELKQGAHPWKLPSPALPDGRKLSNHNLPVRSEKGLPLAKEKLFSSPETRLCVSELRVVKRKLFGVVCHNLPFRSSEGWGSVAGADGQPPVTSWAGPTPGWVSWLPQQVDQGPESPSRLEPSMGRQCLHPPRSSLAGCRPSPVLTKWLSDAAPGPRPGLEGAARAGHVSQICHS